MTKTGGSAGRLPAHELQESACRLTECQHPELVGAFVMLGVTVLALLLAGAALSRLDEARSALAAERERARAELEAFEAFLARVRSLDAKRPRSDGGVPLPGQGSPPDELEPVRQAYRETVMAVSHHDAEFDETLREGMAAELSPEVAAAVTTGGRLTPGLWNALVSHAVAARDRRERILSDLADERDAVERASETIAPAVATAEAIDTHDEPTASEVIADADRVAYHERQVEALIADRQRTIHETEHERGTWYEYIYGELSTPHPVLSAGTTTLSRLETARDRLAAALAN